jgi:hypothetical protein
MSITPLDLQTIFLRLNEVSKAQSHDQHASALQQNLEAKKLVEKELQNNSSVNQLQEDKEASKVEERHDNKQKEEKRQTGSKENKEDPKLEVVKDPEMGNHIDISG